MFQAKKSGNFTTLVNKTPENHEIGLLCYKIKQLQRQNA